MTSDAVTWLQPQEHTVALNPVRQMSGRWPHKLNMLLPQNTRVTQGNRLLWNSGDFNPEGERSQGRKEVTKTVQAWHQEKLHFGLHIYFSCRSGFLWFQKKNAQEHDFEEIYIKPMFHEMLSKPLSFPETMVIYQIVNPLQDQADVTEVRNFG